MSKTFWNFFREIEICMYFFTGEHVRARRLLLRDHHHASHPDVPMKMLTLAQEEELLQIIKNPKLANLTEGPAHVIVIDIGK